jgi:hypothetical protein
MSSHALAAALAGLALRYPGLIAPCAIAAAPWFGMLGLARVNPRAAVLLYHALCGAIGQRPWRSW